MTVCWWACRQLNFFERLSDYEFCELYELYWCLLLRLLPHFRHVPNNDLVIGRHMTMSSSASYDLLSFQWQFVLYQTGPHLRKHGIASHLIVIDGGIAAGQTTLDIHNKFGPSLSRSPGFCSA